MKKWMMMLLMTILMSSCESDAREESEYELICVEVGDKFIRCENKEVICYSSKYTSSLVTPYCKFKESK